MGKKLAKFLVLSYHCVAAKKFGKGIAYFFGFSDFSMNSFTLFAQVSAVFSN